MKSYKEYKKEYIGESDIASLILAGFKNEEGLVLKELHFGGDGCYKAYIVDGEAEIGSHYKKVAEFNTWMKIYDDHSFVAEFKGNKIEVYRVAEMGCIIRVSD